MIHHITKIACFSGIFGSYYYVAHYNRISSQNKYLAKFLNFVREKKPAYTIVLFKLLLKMNLIQKNGKFSQLVLTDFDSEGKYIQEIQNLGFKGIQIGPVSFNSSAQNEEDYHLGVKHTLSSIYGYRNQKQQTEFQVYLNLVPNLEILKFAPYLLKQNIIQSIQFFSQMQKLSKENKVIDGLVIDFQRKNYPLQKSLEIQNLKDELKTEATSIIKELNQTIKNQIKLSFQKRPYNELKWQNLLNFIIQNEISV